MLTVLTVCKNDRLNLSLTLNSLLSYDTDLEMFVKKIVIKDGLSNDGTVQDFEDYKKSFKAIGVNLTVVSDNDSGIFNAMNAAIDYCESDDLIWFLNAGDTVYENLNLVDLVKALKQFQESDASCCFFRSKNIFQDVNYFMPSENILDRELFLKWARFNTPVHQAVIFKCSSKFIRYSEAFCVSSDSVTIYLNLLETERVQFFPLTICNFYLGGLSGSYTPLSMLRVRIREQQVIGVLRGEPIWSRTLRNISFVIKYCLQSVMPQRYHVMQARARKFIKRRVEI